MHKRKLSQQPSFYERMKINKSRIIQSPVVGVSEVPNPIVLKTTPKKLYNYKAPDSPQQFSEIEEDSLDYSMFSDENSFKDKDEPVKLNDGLRKIEQRLLQKQRTRKMNVNQS
jgi:hypothetical protein